MDVELNDDDVRTLLTGDSEIAKLHRGDVLEMLRSLRLQRRQVRDENLDWKYCFTEIVIGKRIPGTLSTSPSFSGR
jgi:hypothetical protein